MESATPLTEGLSQEAPEVTTEDAHQFTDDEGNVVTIGKVLVFKMSDPSLMGVGISRWERIRIVFWFLVFPLVYTLTGKAEIPRGGVRFKLKARQ